MAILLRDLYKETKSTYGLDLIAGEEGLDHLMNWVYISEDPGTLEFLHGGELIITTGVLCGNEYWLYNFIKGLIEHKTCGLIINIGGPYPYAVRSEALPALSYAMGNTDLRYHTRLLQSDI